MEHVWDMFLDMFGTCLGYVLDMLGTCCGHVLDNILDKFWTMFRQYSGYVFGKVLLDYFCQPSLLKSGARPGPDPSCKKIGPGPWAWPMDFGRGFPGGILRGPVS